MIRFDLRGLNQVANVFIYCYLCFNSMSHSVFPSISTPKFVFLLSGRLYAN